MLPPDPGVDWQTGLMQHWVGGRGHGNPAPLPRGRMGWLEGAMLAAVGPDRSVCGVHMGGSGGSLSQAAHGDEREELRGAATLGQGPGRACHPRGPMRVGSGYSLARPMMVRMYRKMLMMSV